MPLPQHRRRDRSGAGPTPGPSAPPTPPARRRRNERRDRAWRARRRRPCRSRQQAFTLGLIGERRRAGHPALDEAAHRPSNPSSWHSRRSAAAGCREAALISLLGGGDSGITEGAHDPFVLSLNKGTHMQRHMLMQEARTDIDPEFLGKLHNVPRRLGPPALFRCRKGFGPPTVPPRPEPEPGVPSRSARPQVNYRAPALLGRGKVLRSFQSQRGLSD